MKTACRQVFLTGDSVQSGQAVCTGSILMECILTLPLLFILMMGVLQFAHIWTAKQVLAYAAYCATRATLSVRPAEQTRAATAAARQVCAWITLAGLPENMKYRRSIAHTHYLGQFSDVGDPYVTWYEDNPSGIIGGEVEIPGWGTIPESDSVDRRLTVRVDPILRAANLTGNTLGVMSVTVRFKFALLMPVAGQMISWLAHHEQGEKIGTIQVGMGWTGQQTLLPEENGGNTDEHPTPFASQGAFPYLELEETCVLPMPYSTRDFPIDSDSFRFSNSWGRWYVR